MQTVGVIGLGKIGLPIAENLIRSGVRVAGFRRTDMREFARMGGIPARSPADVGAQADVVLSCLPNSQALHEVVQGACGLVQSARPGQIIVELGSHPLHDKESHVAPLARKGAVFLDGEVSGTPDMVRGRKAVVYLAGDADAARTIEPVVRGFADACIYFGPFGSASRVKLVNNLLVAIHIAAAAEAMALARKAGVDLAMLIRAVASGSGGSTQFAIRAPWMAQGRYLPPQGTPVGLSHYFGMIDEFAAGLDTATPLFDRAVEIFERGIEAGVGEMDDAAMVEVLANWPRRAELKHQAGDTTKTAGRPR